MLLIVILANWILIRGVVYCDLIIVALDRHVCIWLILILLVLKLWIGRV